jgi:hypothetical protein
MGKWAVTDETIFVALYLQVTVRSCLRLLQGSLALLCGRGITVPMAPIAGMLANGISHIR